MIRICLAYAILGTQLAVFRYRARRAYAGQGRHWRVGAA